MSVENTAQALAAITDVGLFERLATAILREANTVYSTLVHTGVNADGKTVVSPLDGICFIKGAEPPHMIAVHHTTTARKELQKKWLQDPSKVKQRKGTKAKPVPGDIIKTAKLVDAERENIPNLRATLVLTTTEEPGEDLVRAVERAGRDYGIEIDLWSCSRLCHFLDTQPAGQWLRYSYLNIEHDQLSRELLRELSLKNLKTYSPPDNPNAWIQRELDMTLMSRLSHKMTFLMAGSGLGKTVACHKFLQQYIKNGGFGMILTHEVVSSAVTIEQAVEATLKKLHPSLASAGASALSFCSPRKPLLLVVEDINRSGQARLLTEKLVGWGYTATNDEKGGSPPWSVICPIWPEILAILGDQFRKHIETMILPAEGFSENEGCNAVLSRAVLMGSKLSTLSARSISRAFGNDPLLIALHDQNTAPDPHQVISQFIENSISRTAALAADHFPADYRQALHKLAENMLVYRQVEPSWHEVSGWACLQGKHLHLLAKLAHQGEIISLSGTSDDQHLEFRHDRVRDWLLTDAAAELVSQNLLTEEVLEEPYYAEVLGAVLALEKSTQNFLQRVAVANPLALFHSFRLSSQASMTMAKVAHQMINTWLDDPVTHNRSNLHLRWEALAILSQTDSSQVPALVGKFHDRSINGHLARLRNGDIFGGIDLCAGMEPGVGAPWRDIQIEHAMIHHGGHLARSLDVVLRRESLGRDTRVGALRLAGHIADSSLALAIEVCWSTDDERGDHLADYLWAFAQCCENDPARYLGPVCDAWAALSDEPDKKGMPSPRDELAAHEVRWAFNKWPPVAAINYFIQRESQDELRWQITYMLHGIDHPGAVLYVVQELAEIQQRVEGSGSFSPFLSQVKDEWRRAQEENNRPMSKSSRDALLDVWQDETCNKYLRTQAFSLWAATQCASDIEILRAAIPSDALADNILRERLIRGDQEAVPAMIEKLAADEHVYWWQYGRNIWSPQLSEALDDHLNKRGLRNAQTWGECFDSDWLKSEMIMRLSEDEAERLLLKHWDHLRFSPYYVQTALYFSTPALLELAESAINECPEPAKLLAHLSHHLGIRVKGHPGITREGQVLALVPYLHLLSPLDLSSLWGECNDHGWFSLRREYLDDCLQPPYTKDKWDRGRAMSEFDEMVKENRIFLIEYWVNKFVKIDVSWVEILASLTEWMEQRRSLEAMQLVATAIAHRGTRKDLEFLKIYEGMPETEATQLIADTKFAVERRSLH